MYYITTLKNKSKLRIVEFLFSPSRIGILYIYILLANKNIKDIMRNVLIGKASPEDMNLYPLRYEWAYNLYQEAVRNTWFPHNIPLKEDLEDWNAMTKDEQHAVGFLMAFFNPAELIVNRSIALGIYPYLKSPECQLYVAKQMFEEANHCVAFESVLQIFPLDRQKIFSLHTKLPSMLAKEAYVMKYLKRMTEESIDIGSLEGKKDFVRNLVATNLVMEGTWFYSGFMVALSFKQRNRLHNFGSLINQVARDESVHVKFGINLIKAILEENPQLLTEEFAYEIRDIIIEGVDIETKFNKDLFPHGGILGLDADYVNQYVQFIADKRLEEMGLPKHYAVENPAKWTGNATDVLEIVNLLEQETMLDKAKKSQNKKADFEF